MVSLRRLAPYCGRIASPGSSSRQDGGRSATALAPAAAGTSVDATILALYVVSLPTTYASYAGPTAVGETIAAMRETAEKDWSELPDVHGRAVRGVSGEELAAFGDEVDILVVGSRGYGPMRRLVLGSTADYLQRHARCALLVLPRVGDAAR